MNTGQGTFPEQMAKGPAQGSGPLFGDLMHPPKESFSKPCQGS